MPPSIAGDTPIAGSPRFPLKFCRGPLLQVGPRRLEPVSVGKDWIREIPPQFAAQVLDHFIRITEQNHL